MFQKIATFLLPSEKVKQKRAESQPVKQVNVKKLLPITDGEVSPVKQPTKKQKQTDEHVKPPAKSPAKSPARTIKKVVLEGRQRSPERKKIKASPVLAIEDIKPEVKHVSAKVESVKKGAKTETVKKKDTDKKANTVPRPGKANITIVVETLKEAIKREMLSKTTTSQAKAVLDELIITSAPGQKKKVKDKLKHLYSREYEAIKAI
jgi:hypothetical protein